MYYRPNPDRKLLGTSNLQSKRYDNQYDSMNERLINLFLWKNVTN